MKPRRIILIRHGECHANNDESKFATEPDYTIELTAKGVGQARQAGRALKELLGDESVYFYISPFWRTRSTFENIVRSFPRSQFRYSEEPRLREQEWGYLRTYGELKRLKAERTAYGAFYYRFPGGEAGTDVYDRINDLLGSLHRDFRDKAYPHQLRADYPFAGHSALCHAVVPPDGRGVRGDAFTRELRPDNTGAGRDGRRIPASDPADPESRGVDSPPSHPPARAGRSRITSI